MNRLSKNFISADLKKELLFFSLAAMLLSLFLSRTALSCSMIAFIILSLIHTPVKCLFHRFLSAPLLWGMSLLFIIPLISGAWSGNINGWFSIMVTKAPLFFMPLAFAAPFGFSHKQWKQLGILFITLISAAAAWSLFIYSRDQSLINEGYLKAGSIPTMLDNDRVRFSWLVAIAIMVCITFIFQKENSKQEKIPPERYSRAGIFGLIALGLVFFLHLLAVRTGLISFYISAIVFAIWMIFRKSAAYSMVIILIVLALPLAAYFLLPSFQNRVKFFRYEFPYVKNLSYIPGGNDASRMISLKAGWEVMNDHPLTGPGLGDIDSSTTAWYNKHYPQMLRHEKIAPSSEWLIYGLSNGWPGFIAFSAIMLIPFFLPQRKNISWVILSLVTAFSFLFDIGLEVQFGVFTYSFVVLCWWKMLKDK